MELVDLETFFSREIEEEAVLEDYGSYSQLMYQDGYTDAIDFILDNHKIKNGKIYVEVP